MLGLGTRSIENWPEKSRESARRIIDQYGEPDEVTDSQLIWHKRGPWRQIVASKNLFQHNFPAPHYALFELEPKQEEAIEKKQRRGSARKTATVKLEGKAALVKQALVKEPLRKARLALRNKRAQTAASSSAA